MRSNISFSPVLAISNYTILCDIIGTTPFSCSIIIADVLAAPVSSDIKFTSDTLVFSWTPQSTSPCLSHYSVNVTSIEYTINTTNTSLNLPVPLINNTEYSISVVAVDTGGRYMDPTDIKTFIADVSESVTDLMLHQTGLSIYVSWNKPATPMLLPLLNYIIYSNVTDLYTSITIPAPTTTYNIPDVTVGSIYTVGVAAVNVLGTGNIESALLSIYNYTLVQTTVTHSTISVTIGGTVQSMLSSFITYCCCISSRSVQSYSITNQSTTAADYEIPLKSTSLEMNDNMAYGHVSVGNRSTSGTTSTVYETVYT
uniref:Fibronectin type-III domain-containing protein n=1 Tax=Amphimedon queenslandica TaxID=400682 RepID=A0A1X7TZR8_AMPQE